MAGRIDALRSATPVTAAANDAAIACMPLGIREFYSALLAGDAAAMHATLAVDIRVRFPSYPVLVGRDSAIGYFDFQTTLFRELEFQIVESHVTGGLTAVLWRERGRTADGVPWTADGVDLLRAPSGLVTFIEVGGLPGPLRRELRRFPGPTAISPSKSNGDPA